MGTKKHIELRNAYYKGYFNARLRRHYSVVAPKKMPNTQVYMYLMGYQHGLNSIVDLVETLHIKANENW